MIILWDLLQKYSQNQPQKQKMTKEQLIKFTKIKCKYDGRARRYDSLY